MSDEIRRYFMTRNGVSFEYYVLASDYDRDTQKLQDHVETLAYLARHNYDAAQLLTVERDELRAQVEAMQYALNHILAMQTRGFITLGDNATSMARAALQAKS